MVLYDNMYEVGAKGPKTLIQSPRVSFFEILKAANSSLRLVFDIDSLLQMKQ